MKKISVILPTYNEVENIELIVKKIIDIILLELKNYDYEIIITDNKSEDGTREKIKELCYENKKVKAILNARNFPAGSGRNAFKNVSGDLVITLAADFQDPPEKIPDFVHKWETGSKIVLGVKTKSDTNFIMNLIRKMYYRFMKKISSVEQFENTSTYALYDYTFIKVINNIKDRRMYLRGLVAELGYDISTVGYVQKKRVKGHSSNNFFSLYDIAMRGITSYSKAPLRILTFLGVIIGIISFIVGIAYLIMKLVNWYSFDAGVAPIIIIVAFLGGIQLFSLGMIGEYIIAINERSMDRPMVIEEKRINF